jgi:hypothetical protein
MYGYQEGPLLDLEIEQISRVAQAVTPPPFHAEMHTYVAHTEQQERKKTCGMCLQLAPQTKACLKSSSSLLWIFLQNCSTVLAA